MIEKLKPAMVEYIWGGDNLKNSFNKDCVFGTGESWELSFDERYPSCFSSSQTVKETLTKSDIGKNSEGMQFFPLLIKFIDAKDNLSVQVHPSDDFALKHENSYGKTEMWYVLDAKEGAKLCYGLKEDVDKEELMILMQSGKIMDKLNYVEAKKGDVFFVDSGTIHAIGEGITVYEVQQNSTLTYRLYDFLRKDKEGKFRELHLEKAKLVSNLNKITTNKLPLQEKKIVKNDGKNYLEKEILSFCKYFVAEKYTVKGKVEIDVSKNTFMAFSCVEGEGKFDGKNFVTGDTFFVSADSPKFQIEGESTFVMSKVSKFYIGIDLGGTAIKGAVSTCDGEILYKTQVLTKSESGYERVLEKVVQLCRDMAQTCGLSLSDISGVGMGIPGAIDSKNKKVIYSNNLNWKDVDIQKLVGDKLNLEVRISNDANVATLGEAVFGASASYDSSVLITLGTGVGGGIYIDGNLIEGKNGAGAEFGHMTIVHNGEPCTCGRCGCFEAYASATALIREGKKAMENNKNSSLWTSCGGDINNLDGEVIFDNAKTDPTAKKVVENYLEMLSEGLTNIANIFRPDAILLSGGISKQGESLTKELKKRVGKKIFGGMEVADIEILIAKLGFDAGVLGGVALFVNEK